MPPKVDEESLLQGYEYGRAQSTGWSSWLLALMAAASLVLLAGIFILLGFTYGQASGANHNSNDHAVCAADASAQGANWYSYGGVNNWRFDPTCKGINRKNAHKLQVTQQLDLTSGGVAQASWLGATAEGNIIYKCNGQGVVFAFDEVTGAEIWRNSALGGLGIPFAPPVIGNSSLFVNFANGKLVKLDKATGAVIWNVGVFAPCADGTGRDLYNTPVLAEEDDRVMITTSPQSATCNASYGTAQGFYASTGAQAWVMPLAHGPSGTPADSTENGSGSYTAGFVNTQSKVFVFGSGQAIPNIANSGPIVLSKLTDSVNIVEYITGKLVCYHSFTPDDYGEPGSTCVGLKCYDWDIGSLMLADVKFEGSTAYTPAVIVGTKGGVAAAMRQDTCEVVWQRVMGMPAPQKSTVSGVNALGCTDGCNAYFGVIGFKVGLPASIPTIFVASNYAAQIFAVNLANGKIVWRTQEAMNGVMRTSPSCTKELVIFQVDTGTYEYDSNVNSTAIMRVLDNRDGTVLYSYKGPTSSASPASSSDSSTVHNNKIYWTARNTTLRATLVFSVPA